MLVAVFLIAVAVCAYVPAAVNSREMIAHNRRSELASTLASAVLDQERAVKYASLAPGTYPFPPGQNQPDLPNFSGSVKVTLIDSSLNASATDTGRKEIDVTVSWTDKRRDHGTFIDTTIIAND